MTTLSSFISEVKTGALAKTSHYSINFTPPNIFFGTTLNSSDKVRKLLLYCNSAQLPGINISTFQSRTFGETREMPYDKLYDNVSFSFYVDRDMYIKKFFDTWVDGIQNPTTRTFEYYDQYTTDIEIRIQDVAEKDTYIVKLFEAYPKTISPITIGYDQKEVMQLQVSMNYKYWQSQMISSAKVTDKEGQIRGVVDPFTELSTELNVPFNMDTFMNPGDFISQQLVDLQGLGNFVNTNLGSLKDFFG